MEPEQTFLNLAPEKRRAIVAAAIEEFGRHGYAGASCNAIVQRLGIAKGSLYQYFGSKERMFLFLFGEFTRLIRASVKARARQRNEDFFDQAAAVLEAGIAFIRRYPQYYRFYLQVLSDGSVPRRKELLAQVRQLTTEYFAPLCERARQRGEIRSDIDCVMAIFLVDAILDRFFHACAMPDRAAGILRVDMTDGQQLARLVEQCINVLRRGLGADD